MDIEALFEEIKKQTAAYVTELADDISEAIEQTYDEFKERSQNAFVDAVNTYYSGYMPRHGECRSFSLKNLLILSDYPNLKINGNLAKITVSVSFDFSIDPDEATAFRDSGEYRYSYFNDSKAIDDFSYLTDGDDLFHQSFVLGWHGGAGKGDFHPKNNKPYWRTPYEKYSRWFGDPAPITNPSPFFIFVSKLMSGRDFRNIFHEKYDPLLEKTVEKFYKI